jgi:hypothetical protein
MSKNMIKMAFAFLVAPLAATGMLLHSAPANAKGVAGWAGAPQSGAGCFEEIEGAAYYDYGLKTCGSGGATLEWEIPLPANAGTYNPVVEIGWPAGEPGEDYVWCDVVVCPQTGGYGGCTSSPSIDILGTSGIGNVQPAYSTNGMTVPNDGYMFVSCGMNAGAYVYNVNY